VKLIAAYVATRHAAKLEISSINRELQVLRRMFNLANEWKIVERPLHRVRMLKGENQRDRVLTADEEKKYLRQAAPLLRDVATVLIDCALRPEECLRLKRSTCSTAIWRSPGERRRTPHASSR
jgi:integrase